ncbi:MAG: disulfide bond formation protein B [Gammaproteobacteria bacterium]|nr:disulfide bond formation protein B [Gammaproteobacteria bacterium]
MIEDPIIARESFLIKLEFCGILLMLLLVFIFQIILFEVPCSLCLLQRIGLLGVALGFLMNFRFGPYLSHYVISLLSAFFTSFVALRQMALHKVVGTDSYGGMFLGLHLYTWSFMIAVISVVIITFVLGIDRQFQLQEKSRPRVRFTHFLFMMMFTLVMVNIFSIFQECGLTDCPDSFALDYFWY